MNRVDWGTHVNIPAPVGSTDDVTPWPLLRFHPIGLFDLRRHLGALSYAPGIYNQHQQRFNASDIAWFASGLATRTDRINRNQFYPEHLELRSNTPSGGAGTDIRAALRTQVLNLAFDTASLLDRAFAGTTLMIHIPGSTRPGAPKSPEYIKAHVYFPKHLIEEETHTSQVLADIVQRFIAEVGVPTVSRFERCARTLWSMNQNSGGLVPPLIQHGVQPPATPPDSSVFLYHGRPLQHSSSQSSHSWPPTSQPQSSQPPSSRRAPNSQIPNTSQTGNADAVSHDLDLLQLQLLTYFENEVALKDELADLRLVLTDKEDELSDAQKRIQDLTKQVKTLISLLGNEEDSTSSTESSTISSISSSTTRTNRHSPNVSLRSSHLPGPGSFSNVTPTPSPSRPRSATPKIRTTHPGNSPVHKLAGRSRTQNTVPSLSQMQTSHVVPASEQFVTFLSEKNLGRYTLAINTINRNVAMFNWRSELLEIGISEDCVDDLMGLMAVALERPSR